MKYPQLVSMPSAVSDWLEEQLEARGIDAVVYTRYVLSLLHRDTLDLVCPDQDIQIPKEGSVRGRKRFRRSTCNEWWSHVRADVEQLRRSAAVECLMSASDQKCGIESLVDELCEKLKDFQSSCSESKELSETKPKTELSIDTPLDLAKRYYAAFPALSCKPGTNLITIFPHLCTKRKPTRKSGQHNRSNSCGDKLHRKGDSDTMKSRSGGKPRVSHLNRGKKDFGFTRSMEKASDISDWDVYFMNRQNRAGDEGYSTSDTTGVDELEEVCDLQEKRRSAEEDGHLAKLVAKFDRSIEALWNTEDACVEENEANEYQDLPVDIQDLLSSPTKENSTIELLNNANKRTIINNNNTKSFIQCGTNITSSIWSNNSGLDDLDNGEKSLYDSYCNFYNEALETSNADKILGDQFNYLSVGMNDNLFRSIPNADNAAEENETNLLYEHFSNNENNNRVALNSMKFGSLKSNDFASLPWEIAFPVDRFGSKKWSEAENYSYVGESKFCSPLNGVPFKRAVSKAVNDSFLTLNHNEEVSCFKEVVPKPVLGLPSFNVCNQQNENSVSEEKAVDTSKEEEDLLTSARTHFKPIKQESSETSGNSQAQYADGTTFFIPSSLEHVNYKRSDSGTLYLESEFDTPKKYMEYRVKDAQADQAKWDTDNESCYSIERDFILRFCVKQNEKCCQTELLSDFEASSETEFSPQEVPAKKRVLCDPEEFFFPGDEDLLCDGLLSTPGPVANPEEWAPGPCECSAKHAHSRSRLATRLEPLFNASSETCVRHAAGSTEVEIGGQWNNSWKKCDKCNSNWSTVWLKPEQDGIWKANGVQSWQQIWSSSEELCRTCLGVPAGTGAQSGRSVEYFKLREELSQDGEQLLSDLSCLQRVYMEQLPVAEISCDVTLECLPLGPPSCNKERKRRHSSSLRTCAAAAVPATNVARNSWTSASYMRLGAEYLVERNTFSMPATLRPVTL